MPWPMRFGPLPRMMIFGLSVGSASHVSSKLLYMYGVNDSNSAAQVSMRLKAGISLSSSRFSRTAESLTPRMSPSSSSPKPARFSVRSRSCDMSRRPIISAVRRSSTISVNCCRNHGSILVSSCSCSMVQPLSSARNRAHMRRSVGITSLRRSSGVLFLLLVFGLRAFVVRSGRRNSRPSLPSSSERTPFRNASLKVRPIDIASPTDFICVVKVRSACGNFSKFQRGILTTT